MLYTGPEFFWASISSRFFHSKFSFFENNWKNLLAVFSKLTEFHVSRIQLSKKLNNLKKHPNIKTTPRLRKKFPAGVVRTGLNLSQRTKLREIRSGRIQKFLFILEFEQIIVGWSCQNKLHSTCRQTIEAKKNEQFEILKSSKLHFNLTEKFRLVLSKLDYTCPWEHTWPFFWTIPNVLELLSDCKREILGFYGQKWNLRVPSNIGNLMEIFTFHWNLSGKPVIGSIGTRFILFVKPKF